MENKKIKTITRTICILAVLILCGYIIVKNFPPFGVDLTLTGNKMSDLTPNDRVINFPKPPTQISDLIYFNTKSEGYDSATVSITYKSSIPDQVINLGYKDQPTYHYKSQPIYLPFIENLKWFSLGSKPPFLYQKNPKYLNADQFFNYPPKKENVGTYYLSEDDTINILGGYTPKNSPTTIDAPLRGSLTFYTFLSDEPFDLIIQKQDLNWHDGADPMSINVYKNGTLLIQKKIEDDGITDGSRKVMPPSSTEIAYQEGNPPSGVYKIVINSDGDSIVKQIKSSFSKIVFQGPIYPVNASKAYDANITGNKLLKVYTDASRLSFTTYHATSLQQIDIDGNKIDLTQTLTPVTYDTQSERSIITSPKGDIVIDGTGFFAFSKDQFFTPFIYRKNEIKSTDNLEGVDYILTDYAKAKDVGGGWKSQDVNFDLKDAFYSKANLSWIISAPNLKKNGGSVQYKEIKITLHKNPLLNL